jgi:hypothetical protein
MSLDVLKRPKKSMYPRGEIICRKCGTPIYVYKLKDLADEFSLHCKHCNDRGIYHNYDIAVKELPERRKKPRH